MECTHENNTYPGIVTNAVDTSKIGTVFCNDCKTNVEPTEGMKSAYHARRALRAVKEQVGVPYVHRRPGLIERMVRRVIAGR